MTNFLFLFNAVFKKDTLANVSFHSNNDYASKFTVKLNHDRREMHYIFNEAVHFIDISVFIQLI